MRQVPLCSLCGAPGEFYLSEPDRYLGLNPEMRHPYFRCAVCDHLYQPQIDPALLLPFYPPAYYGAPRTSGLRSRIGNVRQSGRARAVEWRAAKGRAIDIGCGRGLVLEQLQKRGWQVSGMDWNADNARDVAERLGIPVAAGPQALTSLAASCYEAASLFHVLEHEQRPLELLAQVHRLLKPGGRLVVAVPNGASAARALFGRHWAGYDFARHRQVFTPHSLTVALGRTRFSVERIEGRLFDELIDIHRSADLLVPRSSRLRPLIVAMVTIGATSIAAVPRLFGAYSVMYAYARKA
jgi:SAM-dependent methyltransferase